MNPGGLSPEQIKVICGWCKKHMRGPENAPPEHTSHGMCPECYKAMTGRDYVDEEDDDRRPNPPGKSWSPDMITFYQLLIEELPRSGLTTIRARDIEAIARDAGLTSLVGKAKSGGSKPASRRSDVLHRLVEDGLLTKHAHGGFKGNVYYTLNRVEGAGYSTWGPYYEHPPAPTGWVHYDAPVPPPPPPAALLASPDVGLLPPAPAPAPAPAAPRFAGRPLPIGVAPGAKWEVVAAPYGNGHPAWDFLHELRKSNRKVFDGVMETLTRLAASSEIKQSTVSGAEPVLLGPLRNLVWSIKRGQYRLVFAVHQGRIVLVDGFHKNEVETSNKKSRELRYARTKAIYDAYVQGR
jgi:hypothetical protein